MQIDKVQRNTRSYPPDGHDDVLSSKSDSEYDDNAANYQAFHSPFNIPDDDSWWHPKFSVLEGHIEWNTLCVWVHHSLQCFVPTLVGSGLPHHDCVDNMAHHLRVMLLLLKPWRGAADLQNSNLSWTESYNTWLSEAEGMCPCKQHLIDNIQAIQECKDACDHHRALHCQHGMAVGSSDISRELCSNDEQENLVPWNFEPEDMGSGCLHFLLALEESQSHLHLVQQDICFDCINHLTHGDRFSVWSPHMEGKASQSNVSCKINVSGSQLSLEDKWRAVYSEHVQHLKQLLLSNRQSDNKCNNIPQDCSTIESTSAIWMGACPNV